MSDLAPLHNDVDPDVQIGGNLASGGQALRWAEQPLASGPAKSGGPIRYTLPQDQAVTIAIEDPAGNRIRNLISNQRRKAGENVEYWDGRNDYGRAAAPGAYRWKGLRHDALHAKFEFAFYNPGNPP